MELHLRAVGHALQLADILGEAVLHRFEGLVVDLA